VGYVAKELDIEKPDALELDSMEPIRSLMT
jgi:hypothetical protein